MIPPGAFATLLVLVAQATGCGESMCSVSRPEVVDRGDLPSYTVEARRAGVHGSQLLTLQIDERGNVVGASFDRLLGHGMDERVLTFARTIHFTPATRCDRPVSSTWKIRLNFEVEP